MISVILPAYNEEKAIGEVIRNIQSILTGMKHEILVIDDGSDDTTGDVADKAGAKVIRHPHNIGYGRSLKDGIRVAQYDIIVISDADGSYPAEHIPALLDRFRQGFNMVVGQRTGAHYDESLYKMLLRKVLTWLVEFTTGRNIPDINSGLRVFSKREILPHIDHLCETFSFTTSMTLAYMMTSKFVTYIPIGYHKRVGSTKVHLFRDSLRTLQIIVQSILFYNPIKLFLAISFFHAFLAALLLIIAVIFKLSFAYFLSMGSVFMVFLVFYLGLHADLMRQLRGSNHEKSMD